MEITELITLGAGAAAIIGTVLVSTRHSTASIRAEMGQRFDQVDARFDQVDARFDQVDARFDRVDARFDQVEARLSRVEARLDRVEARLDQVEVRLERVEMRLDRVEAQLDSSVREHTSLADSLARRDQRIDGLHLAFVEFAQHFLAASPGIKPRQA